MSRAAGRTSRGRCAPAGVLVAILVAAGCSIIDPSTPRQPVPPGMPPPAGAPPPDIDIHAPGRTADLLGGWADALADSGIPRVALQAYGNAEVTIRRTRPACALRWTTLAGIGWVETRHGTYGGSSLGPTGDTSIPIRGVPLDGSPGVVNLPDTDGGRLDGDPEHDRAMGPMQFIPSAWLRYGVDANGDGRADPDNIDDATVAAARLLCDVGPLDTPASWQAAVLQYNRSATYVENVRHAASSYSIPQRP